MQKKQFSGSTYKLLRLTFLHSILITRGLFPGRLNKYPEGFGRVGRDFWFVAFMSRALM